METDKPIRLGRLDFRNIAEQAGIGPNAGSHAFNELARRAARSPDPNIRDLVHGEIHADDQVIDIELLDMFANTRRNYLYRVGEAGRTVIDLAYQQHVSQAPSNER